MFVESCSVDPISNSQVPKEYEPFHTVHYGTEIFQAPNDLIRERKLRFAKEITSWKI